MEQGSGAGDYINAARHHEIEDMQSVERDYPSVDEAVENTASSNEVR